MFGSRHSEQGAAIYRLGDSTFVHSMNKAASGVWLAGDFAVLLPPGALPEDVGAAVHRALIASRHNVPHPTNWSSVGKQVLVVARKKTWRALEKGAVLTHVMRDSTGIRVTPTRNGGSAGDDRGFHQMTGREHTLDARASHRELATVVARALTESE